MESCSETFGKIAQVIEATIKGNLRDSQIGMLKKLFSFLQPFFLYVLSGTHGLQEKSCLHPKFYSK